jgi:flavin-dependent dehydrogenase
MTSGSPDVVVVGASAAGLFAAELLARGGARVRLFDAGEAAPLPRTLIVTARLSDVLGFVPTDAIVNRLTSVKLVSPNRTAVVAMKEPDLIVERAAILRVLKARALEAGAHISTGYRFVGMRAASHGATLSLRDVERNVLVDVSSAKVVGADGGFSAVAKCVERRVRDTVPIVQAVVSLPRGANVQQTRVWFDPAVTPYFFWSIPESPERAAVGLIGNDGRTTKDALGRFLASKRLTPLELQAARVPLFNRSPRPWARLGACDVYLTGDAAGHVKVTTVGGLVTGLRGGRAVADAILTGKPYHEALRALDRELAVHRWVRVLLNHFGPKDYDRLLDLLDVPTKAHLGAYTRDELARTALRLVRTQPRLLGFAWRLVAPRAAMSQARGSTAAALPAFGMNTTSRAGGNGPVRP